MSQQEHVLSHIQLASAGVETKEVPAERGSAAQHNGWARQVPGNGCPDGRPTFSALGRRFVRAGYVLVDVLLVSLNGLIACYLRFVPLPTASRLPYRGVTLSVDDPLTLNVGYLILYAILVVLVCHSQDLYKTRRDRSTARESWAALRSVVLATFLLTAFIYCSNAKIISREVVGITATLNMATLVLWRVWKRHFVTRRVVQGAGSVNALIVGKGPVGQALGRYLDQNKQLGYRVIGFLDSNHHHGSPSSLGNIEDLAQIARAHFVDEVFVTIPSERELVKKIAADARAQRLNVKVVPELYDGLGWSVPMDHIGQFPIMDLHWEPIPVAGLFFKRIADVFLSAVSLVVLSPLFIVFAVVIRLDSAGPAFYKSKRVGRKGRTFTCYKFRTMVPDADQLKERLGHLNERSNGLLFKIENDPRVTRVGKFLRRHSIDELPQLWNVLRGEMSLVGPRPPIPAEFNQYSLEHLRRLDVKPGLTGLWQVSARWDPSFENYMALDLEYIENWNLWLDAEILLRTVPIVLSGSGA